jgi:hypothetical protein
MKPLSIDLRQRIVNAVRHEKNTADEATQRFNVSRASVYNYLQLDQDLGDLTPQKSTGRNRRIPANQEPKRGENVSVVAAMTASGIQAPMMLKGSMDVLAFESWVTQALVPILLTGMVVFLDNVNFHVGPRVRELVERE